MAKDTTEDADVHGPHMTLKSSGRLRKFFVYLSVLLSLAIIIAAAINVRAQTNRSHGYGLALEMPWICIAAVGILSCTAKAGTEMGK